MIKSILAVVLFSFISSDILLSQESHTIQVNGGLIMPMSSSKGLTTSIQFNYEINPEFTLYIYTGYAKWDQFNVIYMEDISNVQKQQYFKTYMADDHTLIPFFIGGKFNFHSNKIFTTFVTFEVGYSHLSYNNYDNFKSVDPESGEVLGYYVDASTKKEISEDLFGIGIGAGLTHPISRNLNLILAFKLNSNINSAYYGFFSTKGTYTIFLAGFNFSI